MRGIRLRRGVAYIPGVEEPDVLPAPDVLCMSDSRQKAPSDLCMKSSIGSWVDGRTNGETGPRHYRKNSHRKTPTQRSTSGENHYYIVGTIQQWGGQRVGAVVLLCSDGDIELGNHGSGCPVKLNRVWRGGVDGIDRMCAYLVIDQPQFWRSWLVSPGRLWVG